MAFKVAVVFFSRRGRLVVLANVIAAGARQVGSLSAPLVYESVYPAITHATHTGLNGLGCELDCISSAK